MYLSAIDISPVRPASSWLKSYYFTRFAFSAAWVTAAFTVANDNRFLAAFLLIAYPAWDAAANYADASRSGGLSDNMSQTLNLTFSTMTAIAVAAALGLGMHLVVGIFGIWAIFAGLFQLTAAVHRWKSARAQWPMILSGVQSMLAGGFMVTIAVGTKPVGITDIAPYAAFGAFYFLVSGISLAISNPRRDTVGSSV